MSLYIFFHLFFLMIGLVSKTTGVEISPIPKDNAKLLQLLGTVALVLVVVLSWTLHTLEKQLIRDAWEIIPAHQFFECGTLLAVKYKTKVYKAAQFYIYFSNNLNEILNRKIHF